MDFGLPTTQIKIVIVMKDSIEMIKKMAMAFTNGKMELLTKVNL